jgi:hypothetical protein
MNVAGLDPSNKKGQRIRWPFVSDAFLYCTTTVKVTGKVSVSDPAVAVTVRL